MYTNYFEKMLVCVNYLGSIFSICDELLPKQELYFKFD
jgi:hypothetical protein